MVYTSYFKKYRKDSLIDGIAISRGVPRWWEGERMIELAPSWELIKSDLDQDEYLNRYFHEVLNKLDFNEVIKKIEGKTLLCWESSEWFCHRHIVACWIEELTGLEVLEI